MFLLWHPSLTAINLSYTFPILETSATALCGTTGNIVYVGINRLRRPQIHQIAPSENTPLAASLPSKRSANLLTARWNGWSFQHRLPFSSHMGWSDLITGVFYALGEVWVCVIYSTFSAYPVDKPTLGGSLCSQLVLTRDLWTNYGDTRVQNQHWFETSSKWTRELYQYQTTCKMSNSTYSKRIGRRKIAKPKGKPKTPHDCAKHNTVHIARDSC